MSFAIIQTGGKQYKVKAGEIIKIEKKDNEIPESIEVAVIGSGSGGGVAANILNEKYEVGIFEKGSFANGETNNETFGYHNFYETYAIQQTRGYKVLLLAGNGVGGGKMPGFGAVLPQSDIELIIDYLRGMTPDA